MGLWGRYFRRGELVEQLSAAGCKTVGPLQRGQEVLGGRRGWQRWKERVKVAETLAWELGCWARVAKAVMACG